MRAKEMTCATKLLDASADAGVGRVQALVSVFGNVDYQGDRVVPGAFKATLADWRNRGDPIPFIWSHDWRNPAAHVGWVPPGEAKETDRGLEVTARLPLDDPDSAKVYRLLADRRVTQFSFAFDVEEEELVEEKTDRGWGGKVNELRRLRLYEVGPCLLGANQETELLEVAARHPASGLTRPEARALARARIGDEKQGRQISTANAAKLGDAIDLIRQVMTAGDDGPDEAARPAQIKGPVRGHSTPTSDAEWDAGAARRNLSDDATAETYRNVFAWLDPDGDPDTMSSYSFPHHFVSSDGRPGAASTRGCSAAIAVLNGGRGGANIPSGDRQGIYSHVARHLRDADLEVPELASADEAGITGRANLTAIADLADGLG